MSSHTVEKSTTFDMNEVARIEVSCAAVASVEVSCAAVASVEVSCAAVHDEDVEEGVEFGCAAAAVVRDGDEFEDDGDFYGTIAAMDAECEQCGNDCDSSLSVGDVPFCSTECIRNAMSPYNHSRSACRYCGFLIGHSPILINGMQYCSPGCVQNSRQPSYICRVCLIRSPTMRGQTSDICESCDYDEGAAAYKDECRRGWH
jgi:hypothetical protein